MLLEPLQGASKCILGCIPNLGVLVISPQGPAMRLHQRQYVSWSQSFMQAHGGTQENASQGPGLSLSHLPDDALSMHAAVHGQRVKAGP